MCLRRPEDSNRSHTSKVINCQNTWHSSHESDSIIYQDIRANSPQEHILFEWRPENKQYEMEKELGSFLIVIRKATVFDNTTKSRRFQLFAP